MSKIEDKSKAVTVTVKQIKGHFGTKPGILPTLKGLGLGKPNKVSTLVDSPEVRGMIKKVHHLVSVIG